jgi:glycosyltransferase involved in cell wall biosynthesis
VHRRVTELVGWRGQVMIGNGIDTRAFTPDGPGAAGEDPYFVYAGTVSEWQGADVFVDAFAQLRRSHPRVRLRFFSEGTGREALEARVRARGIEGVEFHAKGAAQ